jgi:hypothetical protein
MSKGADFVISVVGGVISYFVLQIPSNVMSVVETGNGSAAQLGNVQLYLPSLSLNSHVLAISCLVFLLMISLSTDDEVEGGLLLLLATVASIVLIVLVAIPIGYVLDVLVSAFVDVSFQSIVFGLVFVGLSFYTVFFSVEDAFE